MIVLCVYVKSGWIDTQNLIGMADSCGRMCSMTRTRILGVDPGLRSTGFGVIDWHDGALCYVASGCIKSGEGELPARLKRIFSGLTEIIHQFQPVQAAVEKVFVNINPQSTLSLGQARGAAVCAAVMCDLAVAEYTALQVKQAVVGSGHADKIQVQAMVMRLLELSAAPAADAADALACAVCHAHATQGVAANVWLGRRVRHGRIV